jgi:hypothetical protein
LISEGSLGLSQAYEANKAIQDGADDWILSVIMKFKEMLIC